MRKILAIIAIFLMSWLDVLQASAAVPRLINYQGRLRDREGNPIITAVAKITFALYREAEGGTVLWIETYNQESGVCKKITPDPQGYLSVQLGSCVSFPGDLKFTEGLHLGVTVGDDAEAVPRAPMNSFSYSLNASRLGRFIDTDTDAVLGEALGTATNEIRGYASAGIIFRGSGWDSSSRSVKDVHISLKNTVLDAGRYRLSFLNTANRELMAIDQSGRVGIGTAAPSERLSVAGNASFAGNVLPARDNRHDLGSLGRRWRSLHLSRGSLYLDETKISGSEDGNSITITFPSGRELALGVVDNREGIFRRDQATGLWQELVSGVPAAAGTIGVPPLADAIPEPPAADALLPEEIPLPAEPEPSEISPPGEEQFPPAEEVPAAPAPEFTGQSFPAEPPSFISFVINFFRRLFGF